MFSSVERRRDCSGQKTCLEFYFKYYRYSFVNPLVVTAYSINLSSTIQFICDSDRLLDEIIVNMHLTSASTWKLLQKIMLNVHVNSNRNLSTSLFLNNQTIFLSFLSCSFCLRRLANISCRLLIWWECLLDAFSVQFLAVDFLTPTLIFTSEYDKLLYD